VLHLPGHVWKDRTVNILIGYANSLSRDFAQNHLASSDTTISVLTCGTVGECLDIVDDNLNLDMIGLDMEMPDMDGLSGFEKVQEACLHLVPIAHMLFAVRLSLVSISTGSVGQAVCNK
jgi:CheY-like chemotaxis protein